MSMKWPGGLIRKTPVTPAGPLQNGTAPGMWSMADAAYWIKQGLWPIAGNFLAVEDVFSTWLYTGNGSTQTITNGIDLAGKGGLTWLKSRVSGTYSHQLYDTNRGATNTLSTNNTSAQGVTSDALTSFTSSGFSIGANVGVNTSGATMASWTFRKAPKFFDVVTFSSAGNISHNLGSIPGCIIMKRTDGTGNWQVVHIGTNGYGFLNLTNAFGSTSLPGIGTSGAWVNATSTTFNVDNFWGGGTWVAYLFAHDATSDGIIQCGAFTTDASINASVTLGWEPQWVLVKRTNGAGNWIINDNMRGMSQTTFAELFPNTSGSEVAGSGQEIVPNATGFTTGGGANLQASTPYIYIAIRRGPMRTPTSGTSVFSPLARTGTGATVTITSPGFPPDLVTSQSRTSGNWSAFFDRLRGPLRYLPPSETSAEVTAPGSLTSFNMTGVTLGPDNDASWGYIINSTDAKLNYFFRRAPSFFDVVCYTGTGSNQTLNHNLGITPELMIVKRRTGGTGVWPVYSGDATKALFLNETTAIGASGAWNSTAPTATQFTISGASSAVGAAGSTYVAYLFASCPGVSKVGSYTGTGTTQTINCGFTTGARFVLIKRTDSTGDWYVWDSARGIVAGNDPYLLLNSTAAEVTNTDYIDTDNSGFQISSTAPAAINANGGTYIFLAVA